ncbi:hypothetical protein [Kitasatospora sp. NPDC005748]|uniref:hypothetical protein n=1 Tax=Kitasatospora sp. NPDC005748 TaxID=3157063 RepID=UPI0033CF9574
MTARLPAALAPWAAGLSALTPELAVALGPLLRRLDALIGEREPVVDDRGTPDGHGGLARSGRPDQLLPSEWLLADEAPDEFLRRLAEGELLHLAPEFRAPTVRGRIVALADTGPAQAGAGRLVQLAALLVLHRRAAARGTELVVGILGDPPGQWLTGDLPELLPRWLAARRHTDPTPEDVRRARQGLDDADRSWLLTSPRLADRLASPQHVLASEPSGWSADGAVRVTVRLARTSVELPLPPAPIAVRALRGAEFRRAAPAVVAVPVGATGRAQPVFTTDARTLLLRGRNTATLLAANLPGAGPEHDGAIRTRRHHLHGPVVAAGRIGRRLIALHLRGERLLPYVSGRPLGASGEFTVELAALGLDRAVLEPVCTGPLRPVLRDGDDLLCPLGGRWWRIERGGSARDDGPLAPGAEERGFQRVRERRLFPHPLLPEAERARHVVHGGTTQAWSEDGRNWVVQPRQGGRVRLSFRERAEVVGLVHQGAVPALITCTLDGRQVRSIRPDGTRTLGRFSGGVSPAAVHPTLPLLAAEPRPGRIVIGDANTGRVLYHLGSDQ